MITITFIIKMHFAFAYLCILNLSFAIVLLSLC
jgi:hypothetical protein